MNMVIPKKDPRFSGEKIFASRAIQEGAITPAPNENQVRQIKNRTNARSGKYLAIKAHNIIIQTGNRSRKSPQPTTIRFIVEKRSVIRAENNCGRNHPAEVMILTKPIGISEGVNLLMNKGKIVADEIKLLPNQKVAPSSKLTVKFQR
jgi:hypothetical protein